MVQQRKNDSRQILSRHSGALPLILNAEGLLWNTILNEYRTGKKNLFALAMIDSGLVEKRVDMCDDDL